MSQPLGSLAIQRLGDSAFLGGASIDPSELHLDLASPGRMRLFELPFGALPVGLLGFPTAKLRCPFAFRLHCFTNAVDDA